MEKIIFLVKKTRPPTPALPIPSHKKQPISKIRSIFKTFQKHLSAWNDPQKNWIFENKAKREKAKILPILLF